MKLNSFQCKSKNNELVNKYIFGKHYDHAINEKTIKKGLPIRFLPIENGQIFNWDWALKRIPLNIGSFLLPYVVACSYLYSGLSLVCCKQMNRIGCGHCKQSSR